MLSIFCLQNPCNCPLNTPGCTIKGRKIAQRLRAHYFGKSRAILSTRLEKKRPSSSHVKILRLLLGWHDSITWFQHNANSFQLTRDDVGPYGQPYSLTCK